MYNYNSCINGMKQLLQLRWNIYIYNFDEVFKASYNCYGYQLSWFIIPTTMVYDTFLILFIISYKQ